MRASRSGGDSGRKGGLSDPATTAAGQRSEIRLPSIAKVASVPPTR